MINIIVKRLLVGLTLLAAAGVASLSHAQTATVRTLVVYDSPPGNSYSNLGKAYAIMLQNLLGHFNTTVTLMGVEDYAVGTLNSYDAAFYLGGYYDNPIPQAFLGDVSATPKTVVWFKYNLWKLAWDPVYNFTGRTGINFAGLRGMNSAPTPADPNPGFFDTVQYKGKAMAKYYAYDSSTGAINADPDIGATQVLDSTKATTLVSITNSRTAEVLPYIVRAGNFWYVADMPFSYIGPRDRYLVIADILHDILGTGVTADNHRAMVRLEDVGAITSYTAVRDLTNYLLSRNIPFGVAAIPFYRDPLGAYNGGVAQEIPLSQATDLRRSLDYAKARGGRIVQHGYTHQYANMVNPWTGVSGDDFEFWNIVDSHPVTEDSIPWAAQRMDAGRADLTSFQFPPFSWEAPHYQSSPNAIRAAADRFTKTWQRVVYYTADNPVLNPQAQNRDFAVGQFFPYIINKDHYGQYVLPENLGNIEYDIRNIDPSSNYTYGPADICGNAEYAKVVRDGFASFFFHPFWLEASLNVPGLADFQAVITCITNLGFTWVDPSTVQ